MQGWFRLEVNGQDTRVEGVDAGLSLGRYLRERGLIPDWVPGLANSGPLVLMADADAGGLLTYRSVDGARLKMPQLAGRSVLTPDFLSQAFPDHPVSKSLARLPCMEATVLGRSNLAALLWEAYYRRDLRAVGQLEEQFDGWISRSADYYSLRAAGLQVLSVAARRRQEAGQMEAHWEEISEAWLVNRFGERFRGLDEIHYVDPAKRRYYRPLTLFECQTLRRQYTEAVTVSGISPGIGDRDCCISLDGVVELRQIVEREEGYWEIGGAAPLTQVAERLAESLPVLSEAIVNQDFRPARNLISMGGFLTSAPSFGGLVPALMALDAIVRLQAVDRSERDVPVSAFLEFPARPEIREGEFIRSVLVPDFSQETIKRRGARRRLCRGYRISRRAAYHPGRIDAVFAVELTDQNIISDAWLAYSGVLDRPGRARRTEQKLEGKPWGEDTIVNALDTLTNDMASRELNRPEMNADYLGQMATTLFQRFFYEHREPRTGWQPLSMTDELLAEKSPFIDTVTGG